MNEERNPIELRDIRLGEFVILPNDTAIKRVE